MCKNQFVFVKYFSKCNLTSNSYLVSVNNITFYWVYWVTELMFLNDSLNLKCLGMMFWKYFINTRKTITDKDTDKTITDNDIFTDKTQFMLLSLSTLFLSPAGFAQNDTFGDDQHPWQNFSISCHP